MNYIRNPTTKILGWLVVKRNAVMGVLNLGVVLLSLNTLRKVEKSSKEADLAFQECALLANRFVDIPVKVEASVADPSSVLPAVGGIILVLCLVTLGYFMLFHGAKVNPPEFSYREDPLIRKGLETNFTDTSLNLRAVLIKHPEGDSTLLIEDGGKYKDIAELGSEYEWPDVPPTPVTTGDVSEVLSSPAAEMVTVALEVLGMVSVSLLVIGAIALIAKT